MWISEFKKKKKQLFDEGISEDEAWRLFLQIVDALADMSTHSILHWGIKLTNIFIGKLIFSVRNLFMVAHTVFFFWIDAQDDCKGLYTNIMTHSFLLR